MKNKKLLIVMGIILTISIILIIILKNNNYEFASTDEGDIFKEEYESLNGEVTPYNQTYPKVNISYDNIEYITIDETLEMLTTGTGVIYIGYAECVYCRSAIQVLSDTAKNTDLDKIYYLDISEVWDVREVDYNGNITIKIAAHEKYDDLLNKLGDYYLESYDIADKDGDMIETGEKRVITPAVLFVVNGKIVSSNLGTLFSQEDPYTALDKDQVAGLSEIYNYGIQDVINGMKDQ